MVFRKLKKFYNGVYVIKKLTVLVSINNKVIYIHMLSISFQILFSLR